MAKITPYLRRTNVTDQIALSGTLSSTDGNRTITGTSTSFTTELNEGDMIELNNDGNHYVVSTITNDTELLILDSDGAQATHSGVGGDRSKNEYLFLPVEVQNWDFESKAVDISLPGNDEDDLSGETGTNFIVPLGNQGSKIRAAGVIVAVDSSELPSLNLQDVYITGTTTSSSTPTYTADNLRNAIARYVAGQSNIDKYRRRIYGWPGWSGAFTSADSDGDTLDSTNYRMWEGYVRNVQTEEKAGEDSQFQYSLRFVVGRGD